MDRSSADAPVSADEARSAWSLEVSSALQVFVGRLVLSGADSASIDAFIMTLPSPTDYAESAVFDRLVKELRARSAEAHAVSVAARAARHLRWHFDQPLQPEVIARGLGCSVS